MTLQAAKVLALKVLKQVMEEKLDHNNVQLAQVRLLFSLFPCPLRSRNILTMDCEKSGHSRNGVLDPQAG